MQLLLLLVPCLVSAAPQQFSTLAQAQAAAQAQEDRLNGQSAFGNSKSAFGSSQASFGNSQATFANSQPSFVSKSASRTEGFGDASDQEIAEIRAGTYKETFDDNPEYNFRYKVADDTEQTYMAMEEQRAGNTVTGSYQYVDPLGSLIVVNYRAGPGGYQETREVKPNFVTIRARPVKTQAQQTVSSFTPPQRPQSNIVSQIVAQIQPLVSQTVTSAVGSSSGTPRFSNRPATGGRTVTIRTRPGRTQFRQRTGRLQTVTPEDQQTVSSDSLAQKLDEQKQNAQRQEDQKQKAQNQEAQRLESQRLESQRLEAQRLEAQALVDQRLEAQRLEAQALEDQRLKAQRLEAQRQEAQKQEAQNQETQRQEVQRLQAASQAPVAPQAEADQLNAQAASSNSQSEIVSQIVAQIQPLVSQTVTSAVGSSSGAPSDSSRPAPVGRTVTRVRLPARNIPGPTAPVLVASGPSADLSSVFGQGGAYNVRFNTPDFNIEY